MMSNVTATLSGTLAGTTYQGAMTPVGLDFKLDAQSAHQQFSTVVPASGNKTVALPQNLGGSGDGQTLFLLTSDRPITVELNGTAALTFTLSKDKGVLIFTGVPAVSQVLLTNNGTTNAKVHVTAVYGQ